MERLDAAKLNTLDFYKHTYAVCEEPVETYKGFTIGLSIPNGGILGVSFWDKTTNEYYSKPTELLPDFPGYFAKEEHIILAKQAIEAGLIEVDQLSLLEAS